ncbi:ABC transporter substrate-binding protein [Paracoccus sp. R12_1]|uniref:ABC transporter substrate-binding protein n=1 Tax=unclassified Paracoccus (in: a-proteobacteria) TaxID=2688777 RepID=UPI001AD9957F|nr:MULTISPECIES: ABC transporter substrate-binding protein [unclassified Paracoccus (in: a-proteobacteria)]MBO9456653.1 ABC transporter substrate-binding protein [Paracoccus sp. R12_2]MBO9487749.1 ABC transporter substrate-binding protein [Paracoccus sp. R12_1]
MNLTSRFLPAVLGAIAFAAPVHAEPTRYPLTLQNCGVEITVEQAPQNAVALGQNSAEILLMLGLQDRLAASAFWPTKVLPELEEANEQVEILSVELPTLEGILAKEPDFVAAQLPLLLGDESKVAKRQDFADLGIPSYLSPGICNTRDDAGDIYGSRDQLWNMGLLYQEIDELSRIFDVADRGQALIEQFKQREADLRARFDKDEDTTFLFWFSSPSAADDAYLGGRNGASGFIADLLGGSNAITTKAEWPTVGWEGIIAADPTYIVAASLDRNRWDLDRAETKIEFLTTDPSVSQMPAVKQGNILTMNGAAMNPTIRTIYGAEELARQLESRQE